MPQFNAGECYQNATKAYSLDVLGSGSKDNTRISGWLVEPYIADVQGVLVFQHWWNHDPILDLYFDTTTFRFDARREYVADFDISAHVDASRTKIKSAVGHDLAFKDGAWFFQREREGGWTDLVPLPSFETRDLMAVEV